MNVQIPIFPGFSNIAICPGPFPGISVCILDKIGKEDHLSSELQEISFKYLPYYQNHVYILFPNNDEEMEKVYFFGSDDDMQRHLHYHLGSRQVHGRYLNVTVSKQWVPHLTVQLVDMEFGHVSQDNIQKYIKSKEMKKSKNLKNTKKSKNLLNNKKTNKKQKSKTEQKPIKIN